MMSRQETTDLVNKIETELKERSKLAEKLQNDVAYYNKLMLLKKLEVETITQHFHGE